MNPNQVKDFKKTKQKVGKQAVRPDNFTQTAFRSKALNLPSQATLLGDKQGVAVNQRNQTLAELLVQLKHYSGSSRKGTCRCGRAWSSARGGFFGQHLLSYRPSSSEVYVPQTPTSACATYLLCTHKHLRIIWVRCWRMWLKVCNAMVAWVVAWVKKTVTCVCVCVCS